ncbi:PhoD-like phosphatase [Cylindrospermum stagnale PCC 7417]|uniref:PhoD-like phosphatase n=1 Tax=Cylindrospermum stagnale PCC 7417 TaxID=56107 RepID=K9X4B0_9NOST|nr:PhoD-like phosphatase [Cylindrospermum stagnale]AFZ26502.1 PhoD-like phosphatase [Cylindrospermum stagnale PCC 7417]
MNYQSGDEFLNNLPLILAGPMLQHTEPESVTVWVALKQPCQVKLKVYETTNDGTVLGNCLLAGRRSTVALGKSLHIVAVTARSTGKDHLSGDGETPAGSDGLRPAKGDGLRPAKGDGLRPAKGDRIYAYDLQFTDQTSQIQQTLSQALCSSRFTTVNISYFEHQKPTFVLPARRLEDLRIVHGSCRKPHGDGFDALPILDCLIENTANQPKQRPQQLFLTGDQIYGDDVADPLLWVCSNLGDALLGWEEQLPVAQTQASDVAYYTPKQLPPGHRAEIATNQAGFTAGLQNKRAKVNSHLLGLGEYYASYLLAWSPVCWPTTWAKGREMMNTRKASRRWDREVGEMRQFIHTLWKVRRALANIPMYTIFDDHDVSDDWNLNQAWCLRVLGRPLGRRTVQNALLAYAVFQAWGNTPGQFEAGKPGEKLLAAAEDWSNSQGMQTEACNAIANYVGMPANNPLTGLPEFVEDGPVLVLARHPEALTWHYTVRCYCHEVIVLDTRTWRGYPADQKPTAPPMLLCPQAFERQLSQPLQQSQIPATLVIAPTNLFGLQIIDQIHHWQLQRDQVFSTDVGDSWNVHSEALAQFINTLFEQRQQVVVLSGDIHYGSVVRMSHASTSPDSEAKSVLVQLTASALKNEETLTRLVHTRLKDWLLREKVRRWLGWSHPPNMVEVSRRQSRRRQPQVNPDWNCALEWIPRQSARTPDFGANVPWLMTPRQKAKNDKWRSLQCLMFWKYPWFQDGREAVGLNNLALVHFELADTQSADKVIQDMYWFSSWYPTQIVYSRFESQLSPNQRLV